MADKTTQVDIQAMTDSSDRFHSGYRSTGIALAISLAAYSGSELWWLRGPEGLGAECAYCLWLWRGCVVTGLPVFMMSFLLQYLHYCGMKREAQAKEASMNFHVYFEMATSPKIDKQEFINLAGREVRNRQEHHGKATKWFNAAEILVNILCATAALNLLLFVLLALS